MLINPRPAVAPALPTAGYPGIVACGDPSAQAADPEAVEQASATLIESTGIAAAVRLLRVPVVAREIAIISQMEGCCMRPFRGVLLVLIASSAFSQNAGERSVGVWK